MAILLAIAFEAALGQSVVRVFEQADGPMLPVTRRIYATRFDTVRTHMIGVELTTTRARAETAATIPFECALTKPDGSAAPAERPLTLQFSAGERESQGANLLWSRPAGDEWPPGAYAVECRAANVAAAKVGFEVARNPPDVTDGEIHVAALRVFPVDVDLPPQPLRRYATRLAAEETRRIGVEVEFSHAPLGHAAKIPVDCWFFWPDGQTSRPLELSYEPQPDWAGGYTAGAMGFEEPGSWLKGVYAVTCALHGRPIAFERFDLF